MSEEDYCDGCDDYYDGIEEGRVELAKELSFNNFVKETIDKNEPPFQSEYDRTKRYLEWIEKRLEVELKKWMKI